MVFYLLLIFVICIYKIKFAVNKNYYLDYMSVEKSKSIKGIFILFVFFRHFVTYVKFNNYLDNPFIKLNSLLGQLIVTIFLFYSGYGILESIKKKKVEYINNIPIKRILKILFDFDLAITIFLIVGIITGHQYSLSKVILSFIGWESIGNSNWYIFAILMTYLFTYISFKTFEKKYILAIVGVTIISLLYIYFMSYFKDAYWYNTILCYVAGMWFSYFRKNIEGLVLENNLTYFFSLFILICLFIIAYKHLNNIMMYEIWALAFTAIIILITMKVSVNNVILQWLGENLFGLFILQRIPMIIFKYMNINSYNNYLYFILCFIATLIITVIFNKLTNRLKMPFVR